MSDQQWTRERVLKLISANSTKVIGGVGLEPGDLQQWFMNSGIAYNIATTVMDDMQAKLDAALEANTSMAQRHQQKVDELAAAGKLNAELRQRVIELEGELALITKTVRGSMCYVGLDEGREGSDGI